MNFKIGGAFRLLKCVTNQNEILHEIKLLKRYFKDIGTLYVTLHGGYGVRCKFMADYLSFLSEDIELETAFLVDCTDETIKTIKPHIKGTGIDLEGIAFCYHREKKKIITSFV